MYREIMYKLYTVQSLYFVSQGGQTITIRYLLQITSDLNIYTMQYDGYKEHTPGTSKQKGNQGKSHGKTAIHEYIGNCMIITISSQFSLAVECIIC